MVNFYLNLTLWASKLSNFCVDLDPYSEYGSTNLLNTGTNSIWIQIHKTGCILFSVHSVLFSYRSSVRGCSSSSALNHDPALLKSNYQHYVIAWPGQQRRSLFGENDGDRVVRREARWARSELDGHNGCVIDWSSWAVLSYCGVNDRLTRERDIAVVIGCSDTLLLNGTNLDFSLAWGDRHKMAMPVPTPHAMMPKRRMDEEVSYGTSVHKYSVSVLTVLSFTLL